MAAPSLTLPKEVLSAELNFVAQAATNRHNRHSILKFILFEFTPGQLSLRSTDSVTTLSDTILLPDSSPTARYLLHSECAEVIHRFPEDQITLHLLPTGITFDNGASRFTAVNGDFNIYPTIDFSNESQEFAQVSSEELGMIFHRLSHATGKLAADGALRSIYCELLPSGGLRFATSNRTVVAIYGDWSDSMLAPESLMLSHEFKDYVDIAPVYSIMYGPRAISFVSDTRIARVQRQEGAYPQNFKYLFTCKSSTKFTVVTKLLVDCLKRVVRINEKETLLTLTKKKQLLFDAKESESGLDYQEDLKLKKVTGLSADKLLKISPRLFLDAADAVLADQVTIEVTDDEKALLLREDGAPTLKGIALQHRANLALKQSS